MPERAGARFGLKPPHGAAPLGQNRPMPCSLRRAVLPALAAAALIPAGRTATAQGTDRLDRGRALLAQYQCGACHAIPGVPASRANVAQPLAAFGRRSYIAGRVPNRPELLARWIVSPQSLVPGTAMPAMGVSPEQAADMAAYLLSLK
jgi:cytochrome c